MSCTNQAFFPYFLPDEKQNFILIRNIVMFLRNPPSIPKPSPNNQNTTPTFAPYSPVLLSRPLHACFHALTKHSPYSFSTNENRSRIVTFRHVDSCLSFIVPFNETTLYSLFSNTLLSLYKNLFSPIILVAVTHCWE